MECYFLVVLVYY